MQTNQLAVLVPFVAVGALYEAHTTLCKASRHQALPAKVSGFFTVQSVEFLGGFRFLMYLKGLWCFRLHTERQLEGLNASFQFRIVLAREGVSPVLLLNHV